MFSIDTAHLSRNLSSSQPSTISSYVPCNRQRARSLRFPGSQSPGHQRFMHLPGIRVSAAESNYPPRLRSKSAPFRPPGHVSPASDVFFTRASSNHLPPLDEGKGGAYPVFLSTWSYNSICERSECDQAPQRHPSLARSVPGLSPTELLIAAPHQFLPHLWCLSTYCARSRFAPCPSRLSSRMFVGNIGQRPTSYLAYQAYTAILGWPTLEAMEHWLDSHASAPPIPSPYVCFSLSRPPVPA